MLGLAGATSTGCGAVRHAPRVSDRAPSRGGAPTPALAPSAASPNLAAIRAEGRKGVVRWEPWSAEALERARRERRFVLIDGAASWCHFCHVMDETTYSDPTIGAILRDRFVTIRFDVDASPELAERYGEWGWPATILLSPDAEELGKLRGYVPAAELYPVLSSLGEKGAVAPLTTASSDGPGAPLDALGWMFARSKRDLDAYYDAELGGWGHRQKAPLGEPAELGVVLAERGDAVARDHAIASLHAEEALIDRVDGGIYQYSAGSDWNEPHFEKLLVVQATNLEAYARAYSIVREPRLLADARDIERYLSTVLSAPDGTFYVTQDADVNAHAPEKPFVDGKAYYAGDRAARAAIGAPAVDAHVYAYENGLAISALVALHAATGEEAFLRRAERAADRLLATHVLPDGGVKHEPDAAAPRYLGDAASLGRALARLAQATGNATYRERARAIATRMLDLFADPGSAALYGQVIDPKAVGVFARRRHAFVENVLAARSLAALADLEGDPSWRERGRRIAAAISTPAAIEGQGRMIGGYLLALDELGIR